MWDLRVSDWLSLDITLNAAGKWGTHYFRGQLSIVSSPGERWVPERQQNAREQAHHGWLSLNLSFQSAKWGDYWHLPQEGMEGLKNRALRKSLIISGPCQ